MMYYSWTLSLLLSLLLQQKNGVWSLSSPKKPHAVVVGAGFSGWGAAQTLCENGCRVTLLDSLPDPTGTTVWENLQ